MIIIIIALLFFITCDLDILVALVCTLESSAESPSILVKEDLDYTLSQTALGGFRKFIRSGFGKYTVSNRPRGIWLKLYSFSKLYCWPVEFEIN